MTDHIQKRVLIAEDERSYSRALTLKLQNAGLEVEAVMNGEEALAALEKSHFDLLLCDLIMPKMNGFQVLEAVQKRDAPVPVIILSNLNQEDDKVRTKGLGAIDYIVKSDTALAAVIEKVIAFLG